MRCHHCKTKFEQYEFLNKFCKELDCQTAKAMFKLGKIKDQKQKDARKETKIAKEKLKTKSDYEKELETVVNKFIRLRDKDLPCVSCDAPAGTYTMSAGHYFPAGSNKSVRFDVDNIHGQCWFNCNKNQHGNLSEYLPRLIKRIGQQRFDELEMRKNTPAHYSIPELIEMKVNFKEKVRKLNT